MVQTTKADVVSPTITTNNPNALLNEDVSHAQQVGQTALEVPNAMLFASQQIFDACLQLFHTTTLCLDVGIGHLVGVEDAVYQNGAQHITHFAQRVRCCFQTLVQRYAHAHAKFRIVFKQRVGPGLTTALYILRPWRCGQVTTVNGGAACSVSNDCPVAKEAAEQAKVWCLTTTSTCPRELKQRVEQLVVFHLVQRDGGAVYLRQFEEEVPIFPLLFAQRRLRLHVNRFELRLALVLHRANFYTEATAGAIFGGHLKRKCLSLEFFVTSLGRFEGFWCVGQFVCVVHFHANDGVRTHKGTFTTLDTNFRVPNGNFGSDVALFPFGGASWIRAIDRQSAHWQ